MSLCQTHSSCHTMPAYAGPCHHAIPCHTMPFMPCHAIPGPVSGSSGPLFESKGARPTRPQSTCDPPLTQHPPCPNSGEGFLIVRVDSGQVVGANPPNMNLPLYWCSLLCLAPAVSGIPPVWVWTGSPASGSPIGPTYGSPSLTGGEAPPFKQKPSRRPPTADMRITHQVASGRRPSAP